MRLINKLLLGICAIGLLTVVSCDKNDDGGGPSTPPAPGVFKGNFANTVTGAESEWVATYTKAELDTTSGNLRITAKNAAGDVIRILLSSAEPGMYELFQNTTSESSYQSTTLSGIATTRTNDVPIGSNPRLSKIQITDNGDTDGKIRGTIPVIHWYTVGPNITDGDDVRVGVFNTTEEFEISLTRVGNLDGSANPSVTANIDGASFNPTFVHTSFGFSLVATDNTRSIIISLPNNTTIGTHDFGEGSFSAYSISYSSGTTGYDMQGTITVTEFNSIARTATGTFEGTATPTDGEDSVSITNGTFKF